MKCLFLSLLMTTQLVAAASTNTSGITVTQANPAPAASQVTAVAASANNSAPTDLKNSPTPADPGNTTPVNSPAVAPSANNNALAVAKDPVPIGNKDSDNTALAAPVAIAKPNEEKSALADSEKGDLEEKEEEEEEEEEPNNSENTDESAGTPKSAADSNVTDETTPPSENAATTLSSPLAVGNALNKAAVIEEKPAAPQVSQEDQEFFKAGDPELQQPNSMNQVNQMGQSSGDNNNQPSAFAGTLTAQ